MDDNSDSHLAASVRASWEVVFRGVAPLGKYRAIIYETRLSLTVSHFPTRLTAVITWMEH